MLKASPEARMLPPRDNRRPWNVIPFPAAAIRHPPAIPAPPAPPRGGFWPALALGVLGIVLVLALGVLGTAWWTVHRISARIARMPDVFTMPEARRPPRAASAGRSVNILVAGLDGEARTGAEHHARSDAIMVLHLDADRRKAWVVSIPRDSWVEIPGHPENKVNAAYSLGGPALFVQTIEGLTGLRMDHLVVLDWTALRRLTDAVGGVPVSILSPAENRGDSTASEVALALSGDMALPYLSERKHLPAGDLDRVKRQQHFLRAFVRQALERNTLANPGALRALAAAVGDAIRVDNRLTAQEILALAASTCHLHAEDFTFLTAPSAGPEMHGEADALAVDRTNGAALWQALATDRVAEFVADHPELVTAEHVR
jgi:LCP family protein required for cell wall assembly